MERAPSSILPGRGSSRREVVGGWKSVQFSTGVWQ